VNRPTTDPARKEAQPPDFVQRGKVLIVRRQFQEAVKVCRLGLLAHPTYVEGRLVLGMALMALNRHDEVLAEVRVALELDPGNPMAYLLKGEALLHKRDFGQAREVLERAQELDPLNVKARKLLEELDEVADYGPDASPRARTVTKVYPAQRAQALNILAPDPSEAIAKANFQEWQPGHEGDSADSTAISDMPKVAEEEPPLAAAPSKEIQPIETGSGEIEEDEYTTAPFLAPTHMVARRRQAQPIVEWEEQTISEDKGDERGDTAAAAGRAAGRIEEGDDEALDEPTPYEGGVSLAARSLGKARALDGPDTGVSGDWDVSDVKLETVRDLRDDDDDPFDDQTEASGQRRAIEVAPEEPTAASPARSARALAADPDDPTRDSLSVRPSEEEEEEEELTDVPGRIRQSGAAPRLPPPPGEAESEAPEDRETVVNADAPPPEALFGDEADEPRAIQPARSVELLRSGERAVRPVATAPDSEVSPRPAPRPPTPAPASPPRPASATPRPASATPRPAAAPLRSGASPRPRTASVPSAPAARAAGPGWGTGGPRSSADPTKAVSLEEASAELRNAPLAKQPSVPSVSQVRYVSGVEVGHVEVESGEILASDDEHPYVSDEPSYSELSDISVEMIPDEVPMPPLPPDARGRPEPEDGPSLFGIEAPLQVGTAEVGGPGTAEVLNAPAFPPGAPPLPTASRAGELPAEVSEEEEHATRVNFDAPEAGFDAPDEELVSFRDGPSAELEPEGLEFQPGEPLAARVSGEIGRYEEPSYEEPSYAEPSYAEPSYPEPSYPEPAPYAPPVAPGASAGRAPTPSPSGDVAIIREPLAPRLSDAGLPSQAYDGFEDSSAGGKVVDLPPPQDRSYQPPPHRPRTPAPSAAVPSRPDADELAVEPEDGSELSWAPRPSPSRTAHLDDDERDEHPYPDDSRAEHTSETAPGGPMKARAGRASEPPRRGFAGGLDDEEVGSSGLFRQRAATEVPDARKVRGPTAKDAKRRRPHPRERTSTTSFLTLLMGEPGSHRGLFLLLGALGVLLAAVGIGLAVRYFRQGELIESRRRQAVLRIQLGNLADFNAAAESLQQIRSHRPNDREVFCALARVQSAITVEFGDTMPGGEAVGTESDLSPECVAAEVYGRLQSGALDKAVAALDRTRQAQGGAALWHYLSGRVKLLEGNAAEAESALQAATQLQTKDALALRWLGEAQAAQGKASEAFATYQRALAVSADHIGTLLSRARLAIETRRSVNEARHDLGTIVQTKNRASRGQQGWAHLLLAQLALKEGRADAARASVQLAKSNAPSKDPTFLDAAASTLIALGEVGEAETMVKASKSLMAGRPQPSYYMALIYQLNGKPNDGLRELDEAQRKGKFADAAVLRAALYLEQRRFKMAEQEAQKALDSTDLPDAHVVMARVDAAEGRHAEAVDRLKRQLEKHPQNPKLLAALGEVYLGWHKLIEARNRLKDALQIDPYAIDVQINLARVFEGLGEHKGAREMLEQATKRNLGNVVAQRELARILLDHGDLNEAATCLQSAAQRAPNDALVRLALARVYTLQRRFEDADRELRIVEALPSQPELSTLALARGRLTLAKGDAVVAVDKLRQAANAIREKSFEPWDLLLRAQLEGRDEEQARRTVREIEGLFPGTPEAHLAQGRMHYHLGQLPAAANKLRAAALALAGQHRRPPAPHAEVLVLLGQVLQDQSRSQEADAKYREASEKCPSCADPLFRRARVLDDAKQTREAIELLQRAATIDPGKFEVQYELGQIHEREGDTEKARAAYRKSLTLNPPSELRDAIKQALENLDAR
jgi:tetratricopeptide (TPR) repeat protein